MNETSELDESVQKAVDEHYKDRFDVMILRYAGDTEDAKRHYSFGGIKEDGSTCGVHVYYNYETETIDHVYESVGESL